MFTIRKKLSATEGTDPNTRYDETCECVQSTFDGGNTWVDNPAADPRISPAFLNPGSDDRCDAAQGVANFVEAFLGGAYEAFNIVGISSWAIQIGFFFTPLGLFYRIALLVADGLINIGSITLQETFDSDTFDEIRDIAFCHLNDEGKFDDQAAFDAFGEQLQEDIGGSAFNIVMALMFNLYGWVGFSNAALEYAEAADCSGAECDWCYEVLLAELPKDSITYTLNFGYGSLAACGLETTAPGGSSIINCSIYFPGAVLKDLTFDYDTGNGAGGASRAWEIRNNSVPVRSGALEGGADSYSLIQTAINVECDEFWFSLDSLGSTLPNCGVLLRLTGSGVNPFPESNC